MLHRRLFPALLPAALLLLATGCGTARPALDGTPAAPPPAHVATLRAEVDRWIGTPHRLGGLDHRGVDCSGFVFRVYQAVYGIDLPRVTEAQVRVGAEVPRRALQPGDLVFFRLSRKSRHVGIYLHDGAFAHASSSRGVMISRLDEPYWQRRYWTARRLLPAAPAPLASDAPPPPTRRAGW